MIANIAPSSSNYEDTHNTLKYANRAKNIKTNVQRNVLNVEYHVSQYTEIINQLRQEITGLKAQLGSGQVSLPIPISTPPSQQAIEKHVEISLRDIQK
jgi:kinesin family protein 18/19